MTYFRECVLVELYLYAVLNIVEMVTSLEIPRVVIESDSTEVVQFLNTSFDDSHQLVDLAQYICHLLEFHRLMRFQHVHRNRGGGRFFL